jgi:hypothetical protein
MAQGEFTHEREIAVPVETLRDFLSDLHNYVRLHPLIESIEDLPPADSLPGARHYRVVDRISMGPFRVRMAYTAALEAVGENTVHGHAWQFPAVRLRTVYALQAAPSGTRLVEHVQVEAPLLLHRFVVEQARHAHAETLTKLKALLEGEFAADR